MYSISAKVWLWLVTLLVFLSSCSREGPEPLWEAESPYGNNYKGGLFPVYIKLKEPVNNANRISWSTRYARIAYRTQATNSKSQITADTAFLYWETPPPVYVEIDSVQIKKDKKDTVVSWKVDTTFYYRDTVFAIIDGAQESLPIIIEVKNILPRIKSLIVGGISKPGDSLLTIAANPGDKLEIRLLLEKPFKNPFNKAFHPEVEMPQILQRDKGNIILRSENDKTGDDSVFVYEWTVPQKEISDSSEYLKIKDSGGQGDRLYKVHLVVYTECSSVWVAAEKELVKYSPAGIEVARIPSNNFNSISDITVNPKNGKLYVTDESKNSFSIYNNYGGLLYRDSTTFKLLSGVALDLDGNYVWIADANVLTSSEASSGASSGTSSISSSSALSSSSVFSSSGSSSSGADSKLSRFLLMSDKISPTPYVYEMPGPIKGLSINQFRSDFVWFATPKSNKVGFTAEPPEPKFIEPKLTPNTWNRPSMVSTDPSNGLAWIADSSRIIAIDTSGKIRAKITGFGFVSSISASKGSVWASDIFSGKVYLFKGPSGSEQDTGLTVISAPGRRVIDGFIAPASVSAYIADGGAWVIDKEAGMAVRLDSIGNKIASGTGLKQPLLGKTVQIVE